MTKIILALLFSTLFVACASLTRVPPQVIKEARLTSPGDFSTFKHDPTELVMGRITHGEKWAIEAWVIDVKNPAGSLEEFKKKVKDNEVVFTDRQQYDVTSYKIDAYPEKGEYSVLSIIQANDHAANPRFANIQILELTCLHPKNKSLGYNVVLSRRSRDGRPDADFVNMGMAVIRSFEFTSP